MKNIFLLLPLLFCASISCQNKNTQNAKQQAVIDAKPIEVPLENGIAKAYFASGCFWCVEAVYESVNGVEEAISGYAGGFTENPTYALSNTGRTGHAEAVVVYYDAEKISFETLITVYFASQNISQFNGQGPDNGSQYRSILFYQNQKEAEIIAQKIDALEAQLGKGKIAAEVQTFNTFWPAEDYHQDYEANHPYHPYIQNVSIPRLKRVKARLPELFAGH